MGHSSLCDAHNAAPAFRAAARPPHDLIDHEAWRRLDRDLLHLAVGAALDIAAELRPRRFRHAPGAPIAPYRQAVAHRGAGAAVSLRVSHHASSASARPSFVLPSRRSRLMLNATSFAVIASRTT